MSETAIQVTPVAAGSVGNPARLGREAVEAGAEQIAKKGDEIAEASADASVRVTRKISLREKYMGRTPGKKSKTGKEVKDRMRKEGKLRKDPISGTESFKASNGKWYDLEYADMSHKTDAVSWWNKTGRGFGVKSPDVRKWMLDSKNYYLDHRSINRSAGARLGETCLPPLK